MSDYERKCAVKRANADARKAVREWHKLGTVSIDDIIRRMGYNQHGLYEFTKKCWGCGSYTLRLDTYTLIHGRGDDKKITVEVQ